MTEQKIKELTDEYKRLQGFWKLNKSLENQGVYGFIKTEQKIKYLEFFDFFEQKILKVKNERT